MIQFSFEEALIAFSAINAVAYQEQGKNVSRAFPVTEQKDAAELGKAMKDALTDENDKIKAGEVELNTSCKALLLKCLNREWTAFDAIHKLSLEEKLK